jgi:hypothetical protein
MNNEITDAQDELLERTRIVGNAPHMDANKAAEILKALDPSKIISGSQAKIEEAKMASMANERASREPLPGPASKIFNTESLTVKTSIGEVTIRPMVSYDINIFKLINSPFYSILMGDTIKTEANQLFTTEEESYEMIWQFTHSCKEAYNLFKKGKEAYRDKVMEDISFVYNPADAVMLVEKIMQHIFNVNMARVDFTVPETNNDQNADIKKNIIPQPITDTTN